jgi:hypothetical protein
MSDDTTLDDLDDAGDGEERLHPILSNEEFRAAQTAALKEITKQRKALARDSVIEEEKARLLSEGAAVITDEDRIVDVTIDLPAYTKDFKVNMKPYENGRTYKVSVRVARTIYEQMWRCWRHDDQIDGKSLHETMVRAVKRAPNLINGRTGAVLHAAG